MFFCRENLPSHFKYKDYCPVVFRKLRERFGVNEEDYLVITSTNPVFCFVYVFSKCFGAIGLEIAILSVFFVHIYFSEQSKVFHKTKI